MLLCVFGVKGVRCAVCVVWHAEKPAVCTFKTSPCVRAPRPHVVTTCGLGAGTHGDVLRVTRTRTRNTPTHKRTHTHVHTQTNTRTDTHTHKHTQKTRNTQDKNRKTTSFRTTNRCFVFFDAPENVICTKSLFHMSVAGRPARALAAGAPWTHNVA